MQAHMTIPFGLLLTGGSLVFGAFLIVSLVILAYSLYTRSGSGINQHPYADLDHSSGHETPSELTHDITGDVRNWDRGVAGHHGNRHSRGAPS